MRILILGAVALGGYFGGRFHQARHDPCFLVRPARAAALALYGLRISSGLGDYQAAVTTITPDALQPGWDVLLLTCKAYDLAEAMETIRPAVDARTAILPTVKPAAGDTLTYLSRTLRIVRVDTSVDGSMMTLTCEEKTA
jgi:2-dehydropantoate 2-reductase